MKKLLIFFFICILVISCNNEREIDREKLAKAFVEILIAKEKYSNNYSEFKNVRDSVFVKYNYSETEYTKELNSVLNNDDWESFYDSSQSYLVKLRDNK